MGKHDINENAPAIHKDLERHYKDVIALKSGQLEEAKEILDRAMKTIDRLELVVKEKDALIEQLEKALVQQTIRATVTEGTNGK